MKLRRSYVGLISLAVSSLFVLAACAQAPEPTATPTTFNPTAATGGAARPIATAVASTASTATTEPAPPAGGDGAAGQVAFGANGCSGCHSTGSNRVVGPGLAGIGELAASRVAGQSADEYIENSIRNPNDYVVDTFTAGLMPSTFASLSDAEINNLVAYLKTLK